jgi:ribosomal protein RSM22 (predicted rRNA methylase)
LSPALPPALRAALEDLAGRFPGKDLAAASLRLTEDYKAGRGSRLPAPVDVAAYAIARMPATYAACASALAEARERVDATPRTLLDIGCGPGTAAWAVTEAYPDLRSAILIDTHPGMMALGRDLARSGPPALLAADWHRGGFGEVTAGADMVVASYALNEVAPAEAARIAKRLFGLAGQVLILVEPGTPKGFAGLSAARSALGDAGAQIAAPCPGAIACPAIAPDWCHFAVRLPRLRAHKTAKGADVPFEDEPFSYLVVTKPGVTIMPAPARILRPPRADKAGTAFSLCTPTGARMTTVPSRDRDAHRLTRRLGWGDAFVLSPEDQP